ncbi:hypothetical protein L8S61_06220 [Enterobacter roggenkampii]|uniref:hypothetical protein n=1 Tax=Enterobacter TaxID=547 RepID=UPI00092E866E|nr:MULTISPECIES: hypothetical protein [Enterobacter]MCK6786621.1 hypothetical protein [Enterobacter roggenkampii]MCK7358318.1 hypothetical protein [Enterobacter roggenkampii]MCM7835471.1 hypothetical protein [Enterobacter asburiae]HDW3273472.1 hypothetical protein [Enterobacter asburiae]
MYKLAIGVQITDTRSQKIARINKKLSLASIFFPRRLPDENLVNSRYNYGAVAQKKRSYVKKGKKKPNAMHPVQLGINRHSKLNDGNK